MTRDPALYLGHILESIVFIETYVADLDHDAFVMDQQVQDAVLRRIEIIGEAVKNLPADLKEANPPTFAQMIAERPVRDLRPICKGSVRATPNQTA